MWMSAATAPANGARGVRTSPRPLPIAAPPSRKNGTSEPSAAAQSRSTPGSGASPKSRQHPRRTAAASLLPPPRPPPDGIRFSRSIRTPPRHPGLLEKQTGGTMGQVVLPEIGKCRAVHPDAAARGPQDNPVAERDRLEDGAQFVVTVPARAKHRKTEVDFRRCEDADLRAHRRPQGYCGRFQAVHLISEPSRGRNGRFEGGIFVSISLSSILMASPALGYSISKRDGNRQVGPWTHSRSRTWSTGSSSQYHEISRGIAWPTSFP